MSANFDPKPVKLTKKVAKPPVVEENKHAVGAEVGKKIVQARNALQLKQKDLCMKTNLALHIITDWENGTALFDKKIAAKIESALKITLG